MYKKILLIFCLLLLYLNLYAAKVIPPGREGYFISIIRPYESGIYNYKLKNVLIEKDSVRYEFCKEEECFYVLLKEKSKVSDSIATTKNFAIFLEDIPKNIDVSPLIDVIVKNETKSVFKSADDISGRVLIPENIKTIYVVIILLILVLIMSLYKKTSEKINIITNILESFSKRAYTVFFIIIICFATYMRFRNICLPIVEEGSVMRLLYSYNSWLYNLFISSDLRHPGLYFAILKPFVLIFENPACMARIVSATLSVLAVVVFGLILLNVSYVSSLLGMLIFSIHPEFIHRSREITDISLFIFTSLSSIFFLINFEKTGKKRDLAFFILFLILSCYSSYAAYVNLFAIFIYFFVNKKLRIYLKYFVVVVVFILPYLYKILSSLRNEFFVKSMSMKFPNVIWGGESFIYFAQKSLALLFAGEYTVLIFALLIAKVIIDYRNLASNSLFLFLFIFNFGFILFSLMFRMMPYYFIFLPVSVILLITYQLNTDTNLFKRLFPFVSLIFIFYFFYQYLLCRFETIYIQSYHLRNNPELVTKIVKSYGVNDIVIDIENNKYSLGYYFFNEPYETLIKKGCDFSDNGGLVCKESLSGRAITALTRISSIQDGWEAKSLERLKNLPYERFCFVYDKNYQNLQILSYIQNNCKPLSLGEKFLVYMCNG